MPEPNTPIRRILCIDIGTSGQSVLFRRTGTDLAEMTRLVLPPPSLILSRRIEEATAQRRDIFLAGSAMGREFLPALAQHIRQGCRAAMDERTAKAVYKNTDDAEAAGMDILPDCPAGYMFLPANEVDMAFWRGFCRMLAIEEPPVTAIAALDTGEGQSDGNGQCSGGMWYWKTVLAEHAATGAPPGAFLLSGVPGDMPRLAAIHNATKALVTDTGIASLLGLLADPAVLERSFRQGVTLLSAGEVHVTAFLVWRGKIFGMYEHHTERADTDRVLRDLAEFRLGWLPDEAVREAGGHGTAFATLPPEAEGFPATYVTGKNKLAYTGHGKIDQNAESAFTGCLGLALAADSGNITLDGEWTQ